jgi:GT2 family glycosyltransferase
VRNRVPGLTVVTPWLDHPELIHDYELALNSTGVAVIIIDNGSSEGSHWALAQMVDRLGGVLITNPANRWFAAAINQGLDLARTDAICILNNDIMGPPSWVEYAYEDITNYPHALHGPSLMHRSVDGVPYPYLEGWCIGAHSGVWADLGGLDEVGFPLPYWEDNDLSLRAILAGYHLTASAWPLTHKTNGTASHMNGAATAGAAANKRLFEERCRDARRSLSLATASG